MTDYDAIVETAAKASWLADAWGRPEAEYEWDGLMLPSHVYEKHRATSRAALNAAIPGLRELVAKNMEKAVTHDAFRPKARTEAARLIREWRPDHE
jgi:hypothetical protein